jgi:uncharacterized repeat protein (TIGR01451 family)
MKLSATRTENTINAVSRLHDYSIRYAISLVLRRLAQMVRGSRSTLWPHRLVAFILLAGVISMALALTPVWDERRVSAQSLSCGINEITFTTGGVNSKPSINGNGTRIAFESNRDLTGGNADVNLEIFLYDAVTNGFTQVTDTTLGDTGFPSINGDGTRIAFRSNSDPTGGNANGNIEIFLYNAVSNSFTQVTDTTTGVKSAPSISSDGTRIAFNSSNDLTGGNTDSNTEIFLYDAVSNSFTQVTDTTAGDNTSPSINGDGTRIAFLSNNDLTGGNADGNREIFLYDAVSNSFTRVTDTTSTTSAGNFNPSINGDGTRIAFESDLYPAGNPEINREIFLYDSTTGGITEITFTPAGGFNINSSISSDGTRIAFQSTRDLSGGNADGNSDIFLYDAVSNSFTQVTDTTGGANNSPSISGDGTRIAFVSDRFANLGNADGNTEIFLAACLSPQPPTSADLSVSLGADKTIVKQGDRLTYTLTVQNFGSGTAANVVVNNTLSSGTTFVSANANKGGFTTPPVGQSGTVTWNLGNMLNGDQEAAQITVTVIMRGKGTITNTASVSSTTSDPNTANNSASLTTSVASGSGGGGKK